ncbi:acetylornithine deacetylase (ArgE) [Rubellimicrobium thermophilum DSM 16684]|uniref:Acetylornithine deacetylase (ArgE) n=1 Tax=Rubellimicrobium thermophilum DSM 16684 TaxID=1123069 RepID=S9QYY7_9RHOB|nr:acetylornithine deacetylase [Rubellimicrobium thermophilum]EPX84817.1 acetylornithine deacetylase (ArgE) [Rubellimicrobium thermophilum DSM 16684]
MDSITLLDRLIAHQTVSRNPNRALIEDVATLLRGAGLDPVLLPDAEGGKANLFVTAGPRDRGGVMLSGHTDVVPTEGQDWTLPPFVLTRRDGRLYGRGTADMKGFVACALRAMLAASRRPLALPLHLALSYDEELGCLGVPSLIAMLAAAPVRPRLVIVGEPTGMQVATGHKGKVALRAICHGREAHSALAPLGLNAIHLAADLLSVLRAMQARLEREGPRDADYDIPYTTVHAGTIAGGVALNIVPNHCVMDFEIRNVVEDDLSALVAELRQQADRIAQETGEGAAIVIEERFRYPGLGTPTNAAAVRFVQALTGANGTIKVAFGTEGGLFAEGLGVPVVICGPGSMAQGHKADEFVTEDQIARCDAMLDRLLERLEAGLPEV